MTLPWTERHAGKVRTAEQAVAALRSGRRVLIGSGAAEPATLVDAMVRHSDHLADLEIVHLLTLGPAPYVAPALQHRFRHTAFFIGPNVREAVREGRADFMPVFLSEIPELIRSRRVRIDVALIQVSPPDEHGYVSLGVSVDVVRAAVDSARCVLAEVNPNMPRTHGDTFLHVDAIDALVPVATPLLELEREPIDEVARAIGGHVATLVPDGATLQAGIGTIPDAALAALSGRRDLGIHTELLSDGMMQLHASGAVTGSKKTLLPRKMVTSFVMGSAELYRWVDDNPAVELRASDFTNDPQVIARNERMIAINSALAVDLTGQVAADTVGGQFFSGIGGQVDFIRGAARSRGGKPIIALRSTAKNGTISRIVPALEEGAGVVTSRGDVRYVVTEYGVAELWGKSIRERATALIAVAHPSFRAGLLAAAKRRRYVFPDQVIPRANHPFEEVRVEKLTAGDEVLVRPVRLTDERALQEVFYGLSDEHVRNRFLTYKNRHPHKDLQTMVDTDDRTSMGVLALSRGPDEQLLGMARYDLDPATGLGDVAFVVREGWQGRGLGTLLMRRILEVARARGLRGFTADVLATNRPMLAVLHHSGLTLHSELSAGVYHIEGLF